MQTLPTSPEVPGAKYRRCLPFPKFRDANTDAACPSIGLPDRRFFGIPLHPHFENCLTIHNMRSINER